MSVFNIPAKNYHTIYCAFSSAIAPKSRCLGIIPYIPVEGSRKTANLGGKGVKLK